MLIFFFLGHKDKVLFWIAFLLPETSSESLAVWNAQNLFTFSRRNIFIICRRVFGEHNLKGISLLG